MRGFHSLNDLDCDREDLNRRLITPRSEGLDQTEEASTSFMIASGGVLSNGYRHGLTSAWVMAKRRPKEYRRKVDAVTCCSGIYHHTDRVFPAFFQNDILGLLWSAFSPQFQTFRGAR